MATQITTDVKRDDREVADRLWPILLATADHTTRQLLKADRQMRAYLDEDGKITAKAKLDPSGYALNWLEAILAVTGGLIADVRRNDPSRVLYLLQELVLARAEEDDAFDRAWWCWAKMSDYAEADEEPDDLDYPICRSQALGLISGAKEREAEL